MFYAPLWFEERIAIRKPQVKWNVPFHPTVSACKLAFACEPTTSEKWLEKFMTSVQALRLKHLISCFLLSLESRLYLGYEIQTLLWVWVFFYKRPK